MGNSRVVKHFFYGIWREEAWRSISKIQKPAEGNAAAPWNWCRQAGNNCDEQGSLAKNRSRGRKDIWAMKMRRGNDKKARWRLAAQAAATATVVDELVCPTCGCAWKSRVGLYSHMKRHPRYRRASYDDDDDLVLPEEFYLHAIFATVLCFFQWNIFWAIWTQPQYNRLMIDKVVMNLFCIRLSRLSS